ncbi:unnamed protein product [Heterosigma akashiwo]
MGPTNNSSPLTCPTCGINGTNAICELCGVCLRTGMGELWANTPNSKGGHMSMDQKTKFSLPSRIRKSLMRAFSIIQKPAGAQSQSLSTRRPEDPSRSPGSSNTTSSDDRSRGLQEDLENNNNNNENWILNHQREETQQRQLEVVFFNDNEVSERGRQGFGAGRRAGEFLVGLGTAALVGIT